MSRRLVISAVNFTEGGPLEVLRQFVRAAGQELPANWQIVVLVHSRSLISDGRAKIVEVPSTKTSWLRRLVFEYSDCRRIARRLEPDLWVSLHDISPSVGNTPQVVYCHNPAPFFNLTWRDARMEPSLLLFRLFYSLLYRIHLRRNRAVVVQQQWLRRAFLPWIDGRTRVIVAHPRAQDTNRAAGRAVGAGPKRFIYPALPRAFKNFEVIGEALGVLECQRAWRSTVMLTISGTENRYARWVKTTYGGLRSMEFSGRKTRGEMDELYAGADALVFSSRLETWGLPLTEAVGAGLPVVAADLPYARETLGGYGRAAYFDPRNAAELAHLLMSVQEGTIKFAPASSDLPDQPFAPDWISLVRTLTGP